ncbi:MAG: YceD family protein [Janthinobacterium lividum]
MSRPLALDRVGSAGIATLVQADPAELPAVAARLGVPAVQSLRCEFRLRRVGGVVEAHGDLTASLIQQCVVSLDDFDSILRESFIVHFVPAGTEDEEPEPDVPDQIPFEGSVIDLGEAMVEQLALSLDPYPRRPGAEMPAEAVKSEQGAFAALASLRTRQ